MEEEDEIEVGEVDCGMEKTVCSKVDIHSYPTFKEPYSSINQNQYEQVGGLFTSPTQADSTTKLEETLQQFLQKTCKVLSQMLNEITNNERPGKECKDVVIESDKTPDESGEKEEKREDDRKIEGKEEEKDEEIKIEREEEESLSEKVKEVEKEDDEREEKECLSEKEKDVEEEKEGVEKEEKKIEKSALCPKKCSKEKKREGKDESKKKESYENPPHHPKKDHGEKKENQFERFMDIFKKLEIKVPMIRTLQQDVDEKDLHLLMDADEEEKD
ncbi:hypothetical protein V8G54_009944 [Vigna mungo]|uniref:Uncharacterized protein n=1 Tax=Vigna mungo TaxID=3915 RepID=A0AAQ3NXN7_VIGMU